MIHITRIELTNWFRFRRASIALGARAYAVEAETVIPMPGMSDYEAALFLQSGGEWPKKIGGVWHIADPSKSNWGGKTAFVETPPFVFYGWHRFQEGERSPGFEDAWITKGEIAGGVAFILSDRSRVERTRTRGESTQLSYTSPDGVRSYGTRAQEQIDALVGFSADDYFSTAHVRQKTCAQLVSARPAARMDLVAAWLDFAKLDEAGRLVAQRVTARTSDRDRLAAKVADLRVRLRDLGEEEHFGRHLRSLSGEAQFDAFEQEARARVGEAERRAREVREAHAEWSRWRGGEAARERAARAAEELVAEERRLAEMPEVEPVDPQPAYARRQLAIAKLEAAQRVARGEFDGRCPVRAGFTCPARGEINAGVDEAEEALRTARFEYEAAKSGAETASTASLRAKAGQTARDRQAERVEVLRGQAGQTFTDRSVNAPPEVSSAAVEAAERGARAGHAQLAALGLSLRAVSRLRAELAQAEADLAEVERRLTAARAARLVLGRGGAQRRVAEGACEAIARGANRRLAAIGVDLRVGLSWRREGAEPAPSCDACGQGYPKRAAPSSCTRCGAPRGRAVQDRLDVALSDRSGAAEDLAGLALQRSACAFLRRRRGAGWSTLVLDEPFGALDERHREAVARSLAAVRKEDGVEQLLVVAHQPGVLETLPGRILIRSRGGENEVEVIE